MKGMTKGMKAVGEKAFKDGEFEKAVGAYKLAMLYDESGDKRLALALKKADTKWRTSKKSQESDRTEALTAFFVRLEEHNMPEAWQFYNIAKVDKFGTANTDFMERAVEALFQVDMKEVAEAFLKEAQADTKEPTAMQPNAIAKFEQAIATYKLALVEKDGDKKLVLGQRKAEKAFSAFQDKQAQEIFESVSAETVEWLVTETEIQDNSDRFDAALVTEDNLGAHEAYLEMVERVNSNKEWTAKFLAHFAQLTAGIDLKATKALEEAEEQKVRIVVAVGAFRLALVNSTEKDKKLILTARKAEKRYAAYLADERQIALDAEMVAKEGMMRMEVDGPEGGTKVWVKRWFRILVGGHLRMYDGAAVTEQGLSHADVVLEFNCGECEVLLPTVGHADGAAFAFQIDWYLPDEDDGHLDLEESLVVEPIPAKEVSRTQWMDLIKTPPPPTDAPETPTEEEAEVLVGAVLAQTKKSRLKKVKPESQWLRLVTGGSLYVHKDDKYESKLIQKVVGITAELPKVKNKKELKVAPFLFIVKKDGREEYTVETETAAERKEWIEKISACPAQTVGTNYQLNQIAFAKYDGDGDTAFETANWQTAMTLYQKALQIYPHDIHTLRNLEHVKTFVKNDAALTEQEKAEAKTQRRGVLDAGRKLEEGNIHLRRKPPKNEDALRVFKEGAELDPANKKLQLAIRKVEKILSGLVDKAETDKVEAEQGVKKAELDALDAQELAIVEQEMAVDDLDVDSVSEELLWPFTNLVKCGWFRVEQEKSSSGQWDRRFFKLQAGGDLELYTGDEVKTANGSVFRAPGPEAVPETVVSNTKEWAELSFPKKARWDAPHAFRIDYKNYQKDGNRLGDGQLVVEVEYTSKRADKEAVRDEWMKIIKEPPAKIEDGPDVSAEIKAKREEKKAQLVEKRRQLAVQRKEKEIVRDEYEQTKMERRKKLEREQAAKEAAAAEVQQRAQNSIEGLELGTIEEQKIQRDFHMKEGDRWVNAHEHDLAVVEYTKGLDTDYDDPLLEKELLAGWFRMKDESKSHKDAQAWRKTYLRLVAGGVIYCHWDNTAHLAKIKRSSDLAAEYLVREGPLFVEPAKGKVWDQHWFQLKSGGVLYVYKEDPTPPAAEAAVVIKKGPVRVRTYMDATLETQTSEWKPYYYIMMGNGVVNIHTADPDTSANRKHPENARLVSTFTCNQCKIGEPVNAKELVDPTISPGSVFAFVVEPEDGSDTLLVEPTERQPSTKKFRDAWVDPLIKYSGKDPPKPYLRMLGADYTVGELKNKRKDAPHAWRIDSTDPAKPAKLVVAPHQGKRDSDESAARATDSVSERARRDWMKVLRKPPPLRVMPAISAGLRIRSFEDTTLNTAFGDWDDRFLTLGSDGVFQVRLNDPTRRKFANDPDAARLLLQVDCHDVEVSTPNLKQLLHSGLKKELKEFPHSFQIDLKNETVLVDAKTAEAKVEWMKLLKDPLSNPFEEEDEVQKRSCHLQKTLVPLPLLVVSHPKA